MKLSLTAIAALFAATLHSSVATGTRAASSTGNTEDMPNRDLGFMEDLGELVDGTAEVLITKAQSIGFLKLMVSQQIALCLVPFGTNLGDNVWGLPMIWIMELAGPRLGIYLEDMSSWDADLDGYLIVSEMVQGLAVLDHGVLAEFANALAPTCAVAAAKIL